MTIKDIIEIIKESPLFNISTSQEKYDAITHTMEVAGLEYSSEDIKEIVGEVFTAI